MKSIKNMIRTTFVVLCLGGFVYCEYIPPGPKYKCPERALQMYPCECLKGTDDGLYIKCDNTNLASLSVGFRNIAQLDVPVEELIISNGHFERLYGAMFFKMKIRVLKIIDSPIELIDEHTFQGVNETLKILQFFNAKFNEFPKLSLKPLGHLVELTINSHNITTIDKDAFAESHATGVLERFHLINGNLTDLPIEALQPLRKLKLLDLSNNNLTTLRKNQFKNLRDVESLDISFNRITKLDSSHISDLTKMGWCNVSHNALTEISRGAFARNSVLKVLNMSHNKMTRLDANSLRGMRFLRRLYLSDNMITDVGRGTFGSVTRIGTIDLARNKIKKVDFQMFAQLNYVEIIDIAENQITEIQKTSFKDLYLVTINISRNAVSKIENYAFVNCANISLLDLSYNNLTEIPRLTFDETTYATELQLSYNFIQNMSSIPMHNMTGLKVLNVSHNEISVIPKNTFPKLYELHTIDASYNHISSIFNAVFQPLFSLRTLNLSYNHMETIKPPTFGTLPTLLEMDLSNNNLKDIARGALVKLTSLRNLNLENNHLEKMFQIPLSLNHLKMRNNWLTELPDDVWPRMNALLSLDLSGNRLCDNLSGGSFLGLLTLQTLNLNMNGITTVPWQSLVPLSTLQYLYLENNNLTELVKGAFGKLPVVFELNLYNNQIMNISQRAFDGLLQLLTLNISSNGIRTIPNEAFVGLVSLRKLDLSHNNLEKLDNKTHGLLDDCLSLEMIDLSHNRISFVTRKTFPSNPYIPYRLREINLSYNTMPVVTYDLVFGTKKAKVINLSNNFINDIRKGVIGNLTSLETLDLSNNDLQTFDNNTFNLPENITNIYLQNNKIVSLPVSSIANTTVLKKLDVRNNLLTTLEIEVINKVKNGTIVFFSGNPLSCDCRLRPLRHFLDIARNVSEIFADVQCASPTFVAGQSLPEVLDDRLNCISNVNISQSDLASEMYDILPDVRFREITYRSGALNVQWYVTTVKDIADFYVNIRDNNNDVLVEKHLPYDSRFVKIPGSEIIRKEGDFLEVCVLAKNSRGQIGRWFESQCQKLPDDLDKIIKKYSEKYNAVYTVVANQKKRNIALLKTNAAVASSADVSSMSSSFTAFIVALGCIHSVIAMFK